jgi:hypothetical protein
MSISSSGAITTTGVISGSNALSASYAANADTLDGLDSTVFTLTSSFNAFSSSILAQTASLNSFSASVLSYTSSANNRFSSIETVTGSNITRLGALEAATGSLYSYTSSLNLKTASFATTGSNTFIGTQTISGSVLQSGSFTTTGTIIAQTINVQTVTSSIVYSSGSNIFGNLLGDSQRFTGSVLVTGSLTISTGGNASAPTIFGSTIACSPIGCFATSCATSFIGGTVCVGTVCSNNAFYPGFSIGGNPVSAGTGATQVRFSNSGGDLYIGQEGSVGGNFYTGAKAYDNVIFTSCPVNFIFGGVSKAYITQNGVGCFAGAICATNAIFSSTVTANGLVQINKQNEGLILTSGTCTDASYLSTRANNGTGWLIIGSQGTTTGYIQSGTGANESAITTVGCYALTFGANQVERMRITSAGCVGIGTSSPCNNLHVYADNANGIGIGKNLTNANLSANLFLYPSTASSCKRNWAITTYFDRPELLQFRRSCSATSNPYDCGVTIMTLDGMSNNIGIGTNSPDSYLSGTKGLSIVDSTNAALGLSNGTNLWLNYLSGTTYRIWNNSVSEVMTLALNGKVGIGTTNPDNTYQGLTICGTDPSLRLKTSSSSGWVWTEYVNSSGCNNFSMGVNQTIPYFGIKAGSGMDSVHFTMNCSGRIGINTGASTYSQLNVWGSVMINRSKYNWYQGYWTGNSTYWHMKTSLWGGGSPSGNIMYTMSLFKGYYYSYSDSAVREGAYGFHNWVGTIYNPASTGNLFTTVYVSSDGYVVLVVPSGSGETGITIDWHQAYGYPFAEAYVTAAKLYGATTGGY